MGKLVLFLADGTTLDIPLENDRVSIGRRKGNDVCLPYPAVSGEHAVVVPVTAGAVIEDLGSTNGTFINGKRAPRQFLHDGDRIDIGRQKLVYLANVNAVAKPPPRQSSRRPPENLNAGEPTRVDDVDAAAMAAMESGGAPEIDQVPGFAAGDDLESRAELGPVLRVTTGPGAGRSLALTKDETLVGRIGVQVAAVRMVDGGYRLVPIEGAKAPTVNGKPVPDEGTDLRPGDAIEVASVHLTLSLPAFAPSANS